jgi:twitching motility two-component system response regulator PilG
VSERIGTAIKVEAPFPTHLDATAIPGVDLGSSNTEGATEPDSVASIPAAASETANLTGGEDSDSSNIRALVIDESLPVRIQMRQALQPLSWRIDFAATGEQALLLLDTNEYRVVFVAAQLPDMDGYEICRRAKQHGAANAPVVMLTSASSPADRVRGQQAGCDTYLIKPITPQVLRHLLDQYLALG